MYFQNKTSLLFNLFLLIIFSACSSSVKTPKKPNIILIYADDLGIGLLGHEGQQIIKTPNIDKLAQEGVRFKNAYSNMLCAPARASLITGYHDCHQNRFEITEGNLYKNVNHNDSILKQVENKINNSLPTIPEEQIFLGQIALKQKYKTAQIGKLEWGFSTTHKQLKRHGWDYYFGYLDHVRAHGFYPPFLFENGKMIAIGGNTHSDCAKSNEPETLEAFQERWNRNGKKNYSQNIFMDKIMSFLENNKNQPFFLYFPTQLPHGPVSIPAVHPDFINDNRLTQIEKEYASMVKLLDDNVGQIIQKIKDLGIEDNTIVIFTSDNGHEIYYSQKGRILKPYTNIKTGKRFDDLNSKYYSNLAGDVFNGNGGRAGLKRSNLQGGINVPLIVKWPNKIKKGIINNRLVANYDILPTLKDITEFQKDIPTDGISFYNDLIGIQNNKIHDYVIYSSFTGPTLITNDGWKIRTYLKANTFQLYYLPNDFKEEHDLATKYPEKLNELKIKLIKECDGKLENGYYQ